MCYADLKNTISNMDRYSCRYKWDLPILAEQMPIWIKKNYGHGAYATPPLTHGYLNVRRLNLTGVRYLFTLRIHGHHCTSYTPSDDLAPNTTDRNPACP